MGNSTCQQEIHLNFPCAVPTICIKCVARKYECQSRAGPANTQIHIVVGGPFYYTSCTWLNLAPPFPQLLVCVCDTLKPCPAACTWQLNLHMARVGGSRKTHVITLPQLNGVDLLIMHKFTLLSRSHALSLSLSRTVIKLHIHICSIMPRIIYIYECSRLKQFDALT